jgi:hypothetical protein
MNKTPFRQNGVTLISFLVIFVVAGFLILLTLKIIPVYLEHVKVKSCLEGLRSEPGIVEKSPQEVRKLLTTRWDMNSIEGITAEDTVNIEKKNGLMTIQVDYEVEKPILGNMSALMKFNDSITIGNSN